MPLNVRVSMVTHFAWPFGLRAYRDVLVFMYIHVKMWQFENQRE